MNRNSYITQRRLERYDTDLPKRDLILLCDLEDCRYLTTGQIARLRFEDDHANPDAALRAANRMVNRLKDQGLITALDRRVGGVRGGSKGLIWSLTPSGYKMLHLNNGEADKPRHRRFEPSPQFAKHTLAIAEAYIQLSHIPGITLTTAEFEPACWRSYYGTMLRPDLFAVTSDGEYEDYWFIELDLDTEAPSRVIAKCRLYEIYYGTGQEQSRHGLFPKVVWITVSEKRQNSLQGQIAESKELKRKSLFTVIRPDELDALIRKGAGI